MTAVTIYKRSGQYAGFTVEGHAGYAEEGQDIVCAAVSCSGEQKDGYLSCRFPEGLSEKAVLLLDSMVLGLTDIQRSYGKSYIRIAFKEV